MHPMCSSALRSWCRLKGSFDDVGRDKPLLADGVSSFPRGTIDKVIIAGHDNGWEDRLRHLVCVFFNAFRRGVVIRVTNLDTPVFAQAVKIEILVLMVGKPEPLDLGGDGR